MNLFALARQKTWMSSCVLLMIALAFTLKAVIPAGFMPTVSKEGFTKIVICAGMGEKTILVPSGETPSHNHHDGHEDKVCAYQVISSQKLLLNLPAIELSAPALVLLSNPVFPEAPVTAQTFVSLSARGPPAA